MAEPKRFELVQDDAETAASTEPPATTESPFWSEVLLLSLQTLSKRTLVALSNLFCLLTVGSVFVLFYNTPTPSVLQIVSLSIYAVFVATINVIVRRM